MNSIDFIKKSLATTQFLTMSLLDDMKDAPLTPPTSKGGNHPLWILGHWTYSDANLLQHVIKGNENPLIEWKEIFGAGSEPATSADQYPSWDEVRSKFDDVRAQITEYVDQLTEDDLDKPSKNCPPGREEFFGTVGGCLMIMIIHPAMHRGQVADARRMLERPVFI